MKDNFLKNSNTMNINCEVEPNDQEIFMLYSIGFMKQNIAKLTGLNLRYVEERLEALKQRGELTQEIIEKEKSRKKLANNRRKELRRMIALQKDIDEEIVDLHITYYKANLLLGIAEKEDLELLTETIKLSEKLITLKNINFFSRQLAHQNMVSARRFINECIYMIGEDDSRYEKLLEARNALEIIAKQKIAKQMWERGWYSLEDIVNETGLSTGDVIKMKLAVDAERKNHMVSAEAQR